MSTERGSLFELEDLKVDDFDVKKSSPKQSPHSSDPNPAKKRPEPTPSDLRKLGAKSGFTPRTLRRSRKRTGRTEQLNIKVTAHVHKEFYRLADEQDWVLGEVLEHAISALRRELETKTSPNQD